MGIGFMELLVLLVPAAFIAGIEFFPEDSPPETVYVQIEMPPGTRAEATDQVVRRMSATVSIS